MDVKLISSNIDTILLKIISLGDCYGYVISKTLVQITDGAEIKEATLYSGLRRLENNRLIASYWGDETQGGRRKYYSLTDNGYETLAESIRRWEEEKRVMDKILNWGGSQ